MAYVDEGPAGAPVFLCLHGQPTWSYLYRRMIPHFLAAGGRVVAPDFFGFGRSDKPADDAAYTFDFHRNSLLALVRALDLTDITLVVQDWGGLLGLTLPMEMPERFSRAIVMNTALPTGDLPLGKGFLDWRAFANSQPDMAIGKLWRAPARISLPRKPPPMTPPTPTPATRAACAAFPTWCRSSSTVPAPRSAAPRANSGATNGTGRSVMAIGMADPVLGAPAMRLLHRNIRNCPPPLEFAEAGHFVQEWGEAVAPAVIAALRLEENAR